MSFLCHQLCAARPRFFCPSQSTCALEQGPFQCLRHCFLCSLLAPLPNRRLNLPEAGRVVSHPEPHLDSECCNEVFCDDTGRRPVLRSYLSGFRKGQSCLFDCQAGEPALRCAITQSLK